MSKGAFLEAVADIAIDRRQYLRAFLKAIAACSLHGTGSGRTLCGSRLALSVSSRGGRPWIWMRSHPPRTQAIS